MNGFSLTGYGNNRLVKHDIYSQSVINFILIFILKFIYPSSR